MSRLSHVLFSTALCFSIGVLATNAVGGSITTGYPPGSSATPAKAASGPALGKAITLPASAKRYAGKTPPASGAGSPVTFTSGKPALVYPPQDQPSANASPAGGAPGKQIAPAPGARSANMPPVSGEDSERVRASRAFPANLNRGASPATKTVAPTYAAGATNGSPTTATPTAAVRVGGDTGPQGSASVAELARALSYNPDLIYQYVRNNIEFYPIFGVQKGSLGALLDNQGTTYDQAMLMVDLLRASGYTATFTTGVIKVTAAQMNQWYGIDTSNACAVLSLLGKAQIPVYQITATSGGSCPGTTAAMIDASLGHIWVKTVINGTSYYFDPSYKPHTFKTGIDLASPGTTGYDAATYLSAAQSGATITGDYVQNINRANIRSNLTTYANNLAGYLRSNLPSGTLDDVLGGKTITPSYGETQRNTTPPLQNTAYASQEITDVPASAKPTLRIQYQGIDQTYTSDAIYGHRLTVTYNGSNQPVLMLDGTAVGSPGTAVTPGASTTITFTVTHNAYASTFADQTFSQTLTAGGTNTFLISNGWGPVGRGPAQTFQNALNDLRAAGAAAASEPVLGSTLAVVGAQWLAQVAQVAYATGRLGDTTMLHQHHVGIAGYVNNAYVDLPGNIFSAANLSGNVDKENAAFLNTVTHMSILESTTVQQTTSVAAVSTDKLLDIAATNGLPIYSATSANYASAVQPNLVNCSSYYSSFNAYVNAGWRLIVPSRCDLTENHWSGAGYFIVNANTVGALIGGGLFGGFGDGPIFPEDLNAFAGISMPDSYWLASDFGFNSQDPVDLIHGNYLYDHEDINAGVGAFPQSLSFKRLYSSSMRRQNGVLGKGWTHNHQASVAVNSDGFQAMGEDSALDAVGALVEMKASLDLLSDPARPTDKMVAAVLGQRWFGDQLVNNTVIVTRGVNGEVFVKLPDGTYNPPPGNSAKLTQNADGTYNYELVNRAVLKFNAAGQAATYADPSGLQVNYTYSGNALASVTNSLGRTLNLTYTNGRISQVSDGTRSVSYGYDANANLTNFTNTQGSATTFAYGQPGQITQIFYPSFPTTAAVTNTYDSLGRVQTQANALGKVYNYYFAGSRSAEVAPGGGARANYIDGLGRVLQRSTPLLNWTVNTYDGQSRLINTQLPQGNGVTYTYDDASCASAEKRCTHNVRTVSKVGASGSGLTPLTQSFTYESAFNKVATATDARGNLTSYTYTAQGQPLQVTSPVDANGVAPQVNFSYAAYTPSGFPTFYLPSSRTVKTSSTNATVTATTYDATNRYVPKTSTVDSGTGTLNLTTTFSYDGVGNLTQIVGPRTDVVNSVTTAYDSERRPTQVTDAAGKLAQTTYDPDGRPVSVARQIGTQWLVSCSRYSATGKVVRAWGPGQTAAAATCPTEAAPVPITDTAYDDLDRAYQATQYLAAADGGNRVSQIAYNADDTVQSIQKAVGTSLAQSYAQYTYTPNGNLNSSSDAKNNLTVYAYDGFDRRTRMYYPQPSTPGSANTNDYEEYTYDANSNATVLRKRSGSTITQTWDKLNRLTARTYPTTADNVQFAYDLRGLRTASQYANGSHTITYAWDNAGRMLNATAGGKTLTYQYDAAGNRIQTTWPDAFYTTTSYDALNRPTAIKENGSASLASYAYDDLSRRSTVTLGNGTTVQRSYDNQGAIATLKNFLASTSQEVQYTYTRNQIRELTSVAWSNNAYQWTGASTGVQTYNSNGLNRYTGSLLYPYGYDGNGNLTSDSNWTYGYDLDNRLKTASRGLLGTSASLTYDAEGRLRQTAITSGITTTTTNLLYDGQRLVAEYDAAGNTVLRKYVHGPGTDEPIVWYEGTGTTAKNWLYKDHLGSVVATANSTGASTATYSYGPFGEPNVTTGIRFRYTGQQLIGELGLYYYKARFYSPALGRFLQTDPIGYKDDQNLYAYTKNNPTNATDPSGKLSFFWHFGITYWAARDSGMGFGDSVGLAWNTMMVDRGTQGPTAGDANQHSMLGTVDGVMQTMQQGIAAINDIYATASIPVASHSGQDAAAPLHFLQPYQPDAMSIMDWVEHIYEDTFPSSNVISNAYDNTMQILNGRTLTVDSANGGVPNFGGANAQTFK